ncbi:MAG: dephospho-CoA kinase [Flavobacteriales bacterium]
MKIVGLTGGIGSGKSTVARVFETLGVPVFRADDFGRLVLESDQRVVDQVKALFGPDIYVEGSPDRAQIASLVFSDKSRLEALNKIIHPAVARAFEEWHEKQATHACYCIREAAILFESGSYKDCDQIICVSAPGKVRIERVMERDKVSEEQVKARMANQMTQEEKESKSNFIILNDGASAIIPQVIQIHNQVNIDS